MKIEEHLDHWDNPTMCIDPDNCPVVYASIMHEAEKNTKPHTPFSKPSSSFTLAHYVENKPRFLVPVIIPPYVQDIQ